MRVLLTILSLSFFLVACGGSSAEVICDKLDECNILQGQSASECTDEIEDAIDDGRVDEDDVADCADCVEDNTCSEIRNGDCNAACN